MASLTYKLEKLVKRKAEGKRAVVSVNGDPCEFLGVQFGGTSPRVCLRFCGSPKWLTAAEWKREGAAL